MTVCVLSLLLGTPIAAQAAGEGDPVEGGARNPGTNETLALERETEIIAEAVNRATGGGGGGGGTGGGACPEGTVAAGGGCLETAARAAADYAAAARTCAQAGRRLAPANVLLSAAATEGIDLGDGEISSDVTTALPADLNEPLAPLIDAIDAALLGVLDVPELDPLTITGSYTRVNDAGSLAASNLSATAPYRCFV